MIIITTDYGIRVMLQYSYYVMCFLAKEILSLIAISDSLLITVAAMAVYTGYVFMPQHIMAILHYFEVVQWRHLQYHQKVHPLPLVAWNKQTAQELFASWRLISVNKDGFMMWEKSIDERIESVSRRLLICVAVKPHISAKPVIATALTALS